MLQKETKIQRARPVTEEIIIKLFILFKCSNPVISEVRILIQKKVISRPTVSPHTGEHLILFSSHHVIVQVLYYSKLPQVRGQIFTMIIVLSSRIYFRQKFINFLAKTFMNHLYPYYISLFILLILYP